MRWSKAFARQDYERAQFEGVNWEKFTAPPPDADPRGLLAVLRHPLRPADDRRVLSGSDHGHPRRYQRRHLPGLPGAGDLTIWPIRNLGRLIVEMSQGLVSTLRVDEVIEQTAQPLDDRRSHLTSPAQPAGSASDHVAFGYDAESPVLRDISFAGQQGRDHRVDGRHRVGQDQPGEPAAALLRGDR